MNLRGITTIGGMQKLSSPSLVDHKNPAEAGGCSGDLMKKGPLQITEAVNIIGSERRQRQLVEKGGRSPA